MNRFVSAGLLAVLCVAVADAETVIDFEELSVFDGSPPSGTGQYFNGYGAGATTAGFVSQGVSFMTNEFGPGWSYSNVNNNTTPGFTNQFAAFPGGGSNGDGGVTIGSNYALVNTGSSVLLDGTPTNGASLTFQSSVQLNSIDVSNTTYAAQYLLNGLDGFGNPDFDPNAQFSDGDFFRLHINGFDGDQGTGASTGSLIVDLADYAGTGTGDDFFLDGWQTFDLSSFGATKSLLFSTTSSHILDFGGGAIFSDVPAYAGIDDLRFVTAVPESASAIFLSVIGTVVATRRRRR